MSFLPPLPVVRLRQEQARVLALRARRRLQCDRVHPRDARQEVLQLVEDAERSLDCRLVLVRMDPRHGGEGREFLREFGVEFHRARSERIETGVDSKVHLR